MCPVGNTLSMKEMKEVGASPKQHSNQRVAQNHSGVIRR